MSQHPNPFFSTVLNPQPPAGPSDPASASNTPPRARNQQRPAQQGFTAEQRSLQARNRPFASPADAESQASRLKRADAANILDSVEMLIWYANARNEVLVSPSLSSGSKRGRWADA
jgi:hypothetical protein